MAVAMLILLILNRLNVKSFIPYLIVGIFLWEFHTSRYSCNIGRLLVLTIPHDTKEELLFEVRTSIYVAFGIMPIFALQMLGYL